MNCEKCGRPIESSGGQCHCGRYGTHVCNYAQVRCCPGHIREVASTINGDIFDIPKLIAVYDAAKAYVEFQAYCECLSPDEYDDVYDRLLQAVREVEQ